MSLPNDATMALRPLGKGPSFNVFATIVQTRRALSIQLASALRQT